MYIYIYMYIHIHVCGKLQVCMGVSCMLHTLYIPKVQRPLYICCSIHAAMQLHVLQCTMYMYIHVHVHVQCKCTFLVHVHISARTCTRMWNTQRQYSIICPMSLGPSLTYSSGEVESSIDSAISAHHTPCSLDPR